MEKRFQVFVSSTYQDLQEERKEVMQALLELDCIPAGMELFPASSEDQWSLIKRVIDDCDYYILIIGGRYGSSNEEGIGYTEMEYRYALETNKPIIAFLHKTPNEIPIGKSEMRDSNREKLEKFRELAQKKLVKYWTTPDDLGSVVSRSMVKLMKQFPAKGWVKAENIMDEEAAKEMLRLREEVDKLRSKLADQAIKPPVGTENLAKGTELFSFDLKFKGTKYSAYDGYNTYDCFLNFQLSWDEIFSKIAPYLVTEGSESTMKKSIIDITTHKYSSQLEEFKVKEELDELNYFNLGMNDFQTIKIQLRALGLIDLSNKNKSIKDKSTYWTLTSYGERIMTQLVAIPSQLNPS